MNCPNCLYINTVTCTSTHRQVNGILYYLKDPKNFKQYVKQCCLLKYGFGEINASEDFNNRILHLMKIKTCKYIIIANMPLVVYELKFKNTEIFINPYAYMFGVQSNVTVNRNISLQEIADKYEFITLTKYNNYINSLQYENIEDDDMDITDTSDTTDTSDNMPENIERIYLIHDAVAIAAKENVYKVGRTSVQDLSRFKNYSKGSKLLFITVCDNSIILEKNIIELFKIKYKQKKNYGSEYFEGKHKEMIKTINKVIDEYENI